MNVAVTFAAAGLSICALAFTLDGDGRQALLMLGTFALGFSIPDFFRHATRGRGRR